MALLRIGFIVNNDANVPAWYMETIKAVVERGYTVFFLLREEKREKEKKSFLLMAFQMFEQWWFTPEYDALKSISISEYFTGNKKIGLDDNTTLSNPQNIKALALDIIYTTTGNKEEWKTFAEWAAYGLWRVQFGYGAYAEKALPAFWEVMDDAAVSGSSLLVCKNGETSIAYEGTTRTVPYSVRNNLNSLAWKASSYLPLRLAALEKEGADFFTGKPVVQSQYKTQAPGNWQMLWLFLRNLGRYISYKRRSKTHQPFTLLYTFADFDLHNFARNNFTPLRLPDKNVFYADPFLMEQDGLIHLFFEEMNEAKGKAHISVITIDENRNFGAPRVVLEKPYHLSYPFVFLHNDMYYMVPETAANKTVELYKATSFPHHWELVMNLMTGVELLDATLHFADGKWWLFAAGTNHPAASTNDQLYLFYSSELLATDWTPHPQNPVATHTDNCRPAGRIFSHNSKLYRPAQNNASQQYGYGLKLNVIEILNEDVYQEKEVLSVEPGTFELKACHHLDFVAGFIVIDGIEHG